jgi:hypothetical protein
MTVDSDYEMKIYLEPLFRRQTVIYLYGERRAACLILQ